MSRVWVDVFGFSKYECSNDGLIRNKSPRSDRGEFLNPVTDQHGYKRTSLYRGEPLKRVPIIVHRVVWQSFNGPIPAGMQINHKNGVRDDNRLENLEVCTPSENTRHSFQTLGKQPNINPNPGSKNGRAKLNEASVREIRNLIRLGDKDRSIAAKFGVSQAAIWFIRTGQTWTSVA